MGWLNTVLDVANVGMNVAQLGKLNDLQKQGATSAAVQAVYQELRNQIFEFKQTAQSILESEATEPKLAAGALRVLEMRLSESGITPNLFSELNDKEYVAATYKFISDNNARLKGKLSPTEISEVDSLVNTSRLLPDYKNYIDNYSDFQNYKEAKQILDQNGALASPAAGAGLGCLAIVAFFVLSYLFVSIFKNGVAGFIVGAIVSIGGALWLGKYTRRGSLAKKTVNELENKIDVEELAKLDKKYRGNLNKVKKLHETSERQVDAFFGVPSNAELRLETGNTDEIGPASPKEDLEESISALQLEVDNMEAEIYEKYNKKYLLYEDDVDKVIEQLEIDISGLRERGSSVLLGNSNLLAKADEIEAMTKKLKKRAAALKEKSAQLAEQ